MSEENDENDEFETISSFPNLLSDSADLEDRDRNEKISTRKVIAIGLLLLIAILLVMLLFGAMFHRWEAKETVDLSAAIITPIVGIFGAVMGFYFGSPQSKK